MSRQSTVGLRMAWAIGILWGLGAALAWFTHGTFDEIVLRWIVSVVFLLHAERLERETP